jgi:tetratricopeptide (TPR) repeat protein
MKKLLFTIACSALISLSMNAQALKTPAPSPLQTIKQDVGLGSIELSYSRPSLKSRKMFGDIEKWGLVWRTGANQATTLTFSDEVTIGGKKISPGKYGLLSIPDQNEWTFIITKQTDVTGASAYKQDQDVVRVKAKTEKAKEKVETLTMQFGNLKNNGCDLLLAWEDVAVKLPITTDVDAKVMAQIEENMKSDKPAYFQAAMYYFENNKDMDKALTWINKAAELQPEAFWVIHQQANMLAKANKKKEATAAATKSLALAKAAKNDNYIVLNEKLLTKLK